MYHQLKHNQNMYDLSKPIGIGVSKYMGMPNIPLSNSSIKKGHFWIEEEESEKHDRGLQTNQLFDIVSSGLVSPKKGINIDCLVDDINTKIRNLNMETYYQSGRTSITGEFQKTYTLPKIDVHSNEDLQSLI
jgi:hypothetical protein